MRPPGPLVAPKLTDKNMFGLVHMHIVASPALFYLKWVWFASQHLPHVHNLSKQNRKN